MSFASSRHLLATFSALLLICTPARAALVVIPAANASTEAGSSDSSPLGVDAQQRFQQVYGESLLTSMVGNEIVGIGFRVNGGESALPAQTVANYEIRLSTSMRAPGSLSSTFADNRGADEVFVRTGPLTINAGNFPGGSSPNAFGQILFTTPFTYTGGNLLIEIATQGFTSGRNADAVFPDNTGFAQTAFGSTFGATTANAGLFNEAIVMQFNIQPVPEARHAGLLAAGTILVCIGVQRTAKILRRFRAGKRLRFH